MKNEKQRNEKGKTMLNIEYPMLNVEVKKMHEFRIPVLAYSLQLEACSGFPHHMKNQTNNLNNYKN